MTIESLGDYFISRLLDDTSNRKNEFKKLSLAKNISIELYNSVKNNEEKMNQLTLAFKEKVCVG